MNRSKFAQSFALALFATTTITNFAAHETPHERLKYLEKEQQKNSSWYHTAQKTIAEHWLPVAAAAGMWLVNYLCDQDGKDSNLPKIIKDNLLGPDAYKKLCALYATCFAAGVYVDKKVTKPFVRKQEKEAKNIAKAMEKLKKDMIKH